MQKIFFKNSMINKIKLLNLEAEGETEEDNATVFKLKTRINNMKKNNS